MWKAFELVHSTFKSGAELYLEDMLPALDNFVQYGAPQLIEKPQYVEALFSMVSDMFTDNKVGGVDRICACKLAEAMMLSLRGHINNCVHGFVNMAMGVLVSQDVKLKSYKIHLMEMVINAIYYDPILSLQILETQGWTNKFFSLWFGSMTSFTRVHDKQLCILAIIALLDVKPDQIPASVMVGWPRLLQGIKILFDTLPDAMANREEALKDDFQFDSGTYGYEESDDEWDDEEANWHGGENEEEPTGGETKDESTAYLDFLNEEAQKLKATDLDDTDDELGEDSVLLESPLDRIDPYLAFRDSFKKLQEEQPQFCTTLLTHLTSTDQAALLEVCRKADTQEMMGLQSPFPISRARGATANGSS
jgi:hypothetical protein